MIFQNEKKTVIVIQCSLSISWWSHYRWRHRPVNGPRSLARPCILETSNYGQGRRAGEILGVS